MTFDTCGLSPLLIQAASQRGWHVPTDVQAQAIGPILAGRDVCACARTGSGKTGAFALPLLQRLTQTTALAPRLARALILVPTRELAAQVGGEIMALARDLPQRLKTAVVFGGVSINPQMLHLRGGADVVVATPGRLLDLLAHNALKLDALQTLVLDEADRLLDLGFADELGQILQGLPAKRQNLFFSATFPPSVQALADSMLQEPVRIDAAGESSDRPDIQQHAIRVDTHRRSPLLRHLLAEQPWERVLVFVATKYAAEQLADKLRRVGIEAEPFHGMLSQGKRQQVLADFKAHRIRVVVSTDLAGRGIDIAQLPVVINFDLPRSATDYTHRIGRTGRAGEPGLAISFIGADDEAHFQLIEKRQGLHVPREQIDGFEPAQMAPEAPRRTAADGEPGTGGIKGRRPSKKDKLRAAAAAMVLTTGEGESR